MKILAKKMLCAGLLLAVLISVAACGGGSDPTASEAESIVSQDGDVDSELSYLDENGNYVEYDSPYYHENHNPDIHCTITPNGDYIIGDGYPIGEYRHILAYNLKTGNSSSILKVKTILVDNVDYRCDLHARYVFNGKYVSYDTVQNGRREIAIFPVEEINI